ncbi:heme o synthase [Synoicihabitans lomoniglobus]|uniref:Protoheme IX farnesyltransferase n=1 Tax=Synoicihabitans lomoniglobus TaxID=2909285 RepID=A0AAE9ZUL7_9BACT|nr:heme o synthase [Opitutaceae bacterium LMO-M01]WED63085.1 heme o synthase [Opitutaceae bacterium LMO-M01]
MSDPATTSAADATPPQGGWGDYLELTKPRLSMLSVITAMVGYLVVDAPWAWGHFLATMIGTSACAGGVAALNQWMERDTDAKMDRTSDRPIPSGKVPDGAAFVLGWGLCMSGLALLFSFASALAATFALATIITYLAWYTPAKRWSRWSTEIGAIAGAFPPLIGYAAAHGGVEALGWVLFGILALWQIPHFMAIAWTYREDYGRVDFPMLPVRDRSGRSVALWSLVNTVALIVVCLLPSLWGDATWIYGSVTLALGVWFLIRAIAFTRVEGRDQSARKLFFASIIWLPLQLGALVVDRLFLL